MRSPLILVVDDNDAGLMLVVAVLTLEGFEVDTAGSAAELLVRLNERLPDLILMDVQLPGQDGLTLTRQLKADPATEGIPIVALTAHAMPGDREEALRAGCMGYISKPIETRTFGAQVRLFLPRLEVPVPGA
jgi:CheY-like chemotaxis protein